MDAPRLVAVNVGHTQPVPWGSLKASAIDKRPFAGDVEVTPLGLAGDEQTDRKHHGGVDQALYAFAAEDLDRWSAVVGRVLPPGCFGENLTTRGLDVNGAIIGEQWAVGSTVLEVSAPRIPCSVFAGFIGEQNWIKRFIDDQNPGPYLRVLTPGTVRAGDAVTVLHRPDHGLTIRDVYRAKTGDQSLVPRLLEAPALSDALRVWAQSVLDRAR